MTVQGLVMVLGWCSDSVGPWGWYSDSGRFNDSDGNGVIIVLVLVMVLAWCSESAERDVKAGDGARVVFHSAKTLF